MLNWFDIHMQNTFLTKNLHNIIICSWCNVVLPSLYFNIQFVIDETALFKPEGIFSQTNSTGLVKTIIRKRDGEIVVLGLVLHYQ